MRKKPGSETWIDSDDAPELTTEMLADAEVFVGDKFVRRGRGRPPTGTAREIVSFRLDRDLLAKLREAGPGWQSWVNGLLRNAIGLPPAERAASAVVPDVNLSSVAEVTNPGAIANRTIDTASAPKPAAHGGSTRRSKPSRSASAP